MSGIFCHVREEDRRGVAAVKRQGEQAKNVCSITVLLEVIFILFFCVQLVSFVVGES